MNKLDDVSQAIAPEQGELFVCEIANWPIKDDLASMEVPLFSLAKNIDTSTREYRRGNKYIRIIPSSVGSATVFDKDLLLYIASQIVEQLNRNKAEGVERPVPRTVQINTVDFLNGVERGDGRASFERVIDMLRRLRGTTIETNIDTGGVRQTEGFSLINSYNILSDKVRIGTVKKGKKGKEKEESKEFTRILSFTVTISEWLYNGLLNYEVLTLDRGYFKLTSSIERRLYEIARKHCGNQPLFKINIDLLGEKIGTKYKRFHFREELRKVIQADKLPEYRMALDPSQSPDIVVFYTRDSVKLSQEIIRLDAYKWFSNLEKTDTPRKTKSKTLKKPAITDVSSATQE